MEIVISDTNELTELDIRVLAVLTGSTPAATPVKAAPKAKLEKAATAPAPAVEAAPEPEAAPEEAADEDSATLADAVAIATKLVSSGEAAKVKAALSDLGAKRVSELSGSKIASFVSALS